MGKKLGFVVGLLAGAAAAHFAYHRLSDEEKAELKANLQEKADIAKDRAVDYAFYASDAWDDFKESFSDQSQSVSDKLRETAKHGLHHSDSDESDESLRSELDDVATASDDDSDDIVLNSDETFGGADITGETETPNESDTPDKDSDDSSDDSE
ncbi:YtxH domain-containing protein [Secundilactobacillus folii]|uniref:YtxH domain-containing protein n=1 Tax=Secundilactobacillus folii TaxID=2678357 RepID=A0A7X3C2V3_9LACO|nr:YtxH domain-containing protein [Secundilactobacillus folii]MTV83235.1 hypothetical protein [Secundilactobacillus folii]